MVGTFSLSLAIFLIADNVPVIKKKNTDHGIFERKKKKEKKKSSETERESVSPCFPVMDENYLLTAYYSSVYLYMCDGWVSFCMGGRGKVIYRMFLFI